MSTYFIPIKTAVIFFPFLALILTIPFLIFQYRKYGYINKIRLVVVFSFLFYLISAYYMVILPLPKTRDVKSVQRDDIEYTNLKPFKFVEDIKRNTRSELDDPSSYKYLFTEREFLQAIFNVLLTLPLGIYLRYYFGRGLIATILISFTASIFFELTQFSGLYGIYNAPYRVLDIDDLILNTLGGTIGFISAPIFTFFLPKAEKLDENVELETMRVGFPRRLLAFTIDMLIMSFIPYYKLDFRVKYVSFFVYFILIAYITNGRTVGHWITNTKIQGKGDRIGFFEIFLRNGILFFGIIGLNRLLGNLIILDQQLDLYSMALFIALFQVAYIIYLIGDLIYALFQKDRFFYERLSNTRIGIYEEKIGKEDRDGEKYMEKRDNMKFRKSEYEDIDNILEIIEEGKVSLKKAQVPQWIDGYPNRETIMEDIDKGYSYVLTNNDEIVGTAALIYGVEETYKEIFQGEWLSELEEYAILHRVAIKESEKGKSLAVRIMEFVQEDAKDKGMESIRIDTHRKNKSMKKMIEKSGFEYCGIIYLEDGSERIAFEKLIK